MFTHRPGSVHAAAAFGQVYRRMAVETELIDATPHRLVAMLFDGLVEAIVRASSALQQADLEAKGRAIGRAVRIVDEGLKAGLNLERGGGLANDLQDLYGYLTLRLTHANLRNDAAALDECRALVDTLRSAWQAIGPQTAGRTDA